MLSFNDYGNGGKLTIDGREFHLDENEIVDAWIQTSQLIDSRSVGTAVIVVGSDRVAMTTEQWVVANNCFHDFMEKIAIATELEVAHLRENRTLH